ncbi:MAG: glycerol kinase GlpK, partial [Flavobacteriales bacterium]
MKYILTLDQGTTSSRALLIDQAGQVKGMAQKEFQQIFPNPGWVEHDPSEIWSSQLSVIKEVLKTSRVKASSLASIGITNQRETTIAWNAETGEPLCNAIVWQDKRTSDYCDHLKKNGWSSRIQAKTGLIIDSYFSATKMQWILENVEEAKKLLEEKKLRMGTVDTWLMFKLSKGEFHKTDHSNASRSMLFNIHSLNWDEELLELFEIPKHCLPEVHPSIGDFGKVEINGTLIPIGGVAGDQQAALFGQMCFHSGDVKNTYGTGCFMLMNTGTKAHISTVGMLSTIAWSEGSTVQYALEGSVFIAGAAIQWLRDALRLLDHADDSQYFAERAEGNEVVVVPAFVGLGAPHWDMFARGAIFGLTRETGKAEIIKGTLQSLAFQTKDVLEAMQNDTGLEIKLLRADGGASANNWLMQFQADVLNIPIERPLNIESTAMGVSYMAGVSAGFWTQKDLLEMNQTDHCFEPEMKSELRNKLYTQW